MDCELRGVIKVSQMNFHRLRYFVTVARVGNFGRAAQELNMSQPALSRQIQILETEVGSMLFSRENKVIHLTSSGALLLSRSAALLDDVDRLKMDIAALDRLASEHMTVGTIHSVIDGWLADAVSEARDEVPGSTVALREFTSAEIIDRVRRGYLDVGIVGAAPSGPDITIAARFREGYLAVIHRDHRLVGTREVSLVDLAGESFVQFRRGYRIRDTIDIALQDAGVPIEVLCEVESVAAIQTFVTTGRHISLLPRFTAERLERTGGLATVAILDLDISRQIFVIVNTDRPPGRLRRRFLEKVVALGGSFSGIRPSPLEEIPTRRAAQA